MDSFEDTLTALSSSPFSLSLHRKHIRLAEALNGDALAEAREMMVGFLAATDHIWLPHLQGKIDAADLNSLDDVQPILAAFAVAEDDYYSIPLIQKHAEFLTTRLEGNVLPTETTRELLREIAQKATSHISQGHLVWDLWRDWETNLLESSTDPTEKADVIERLEQMYQHRLSQIHSTADQTLQSYSTFVSTYFPADAYESKLVAASKKKSGPARVWSRKETLEMNNDYISYIAYEKKGKKVNPASLSILYERAIASVASTRWLSEEAEAEANVALGALWGDYLEVLRTASDDDLPNEVEAGRRATRSVPGSGSIWARYLRILERNTSDDESTVETIEDAYTRALSANLLQPNVEELVPIVLSRAAAERRHLIIEHDDETDLDIQRLESLVAILQDGITEVRKNSKAGDTKFRLEKYLADLYWTLPNAPLPEKAVEVWQTAAKHYKTSYLAWTTYADLLIKRNDLTKARSLFRDVSQKAIDWPEAIWEQWCNFEHLFGSGEQVEDCLARIAKARGVVENRRAKEAQKVALQYAQYAAVQQAAVPVPETATVDLAADTLMAPDTNSDHMDVDQAVTRGKRRAEDDPSRDAKRFKADHNPNPPAEKLTLKRDRENTTVFVSGLPQVAKESDLEQLFKDCGNIREIKLTTTPEKSYVAAVEFMERENIPAALTKDKKRIHGHEVAVHLVWQSTLYVTNFPERTDDKDIRELFGQFGPIFEVRWPSKKFKSTRRFCYIQYMLPDAAQSALSLNGVEIDKGSGQTMNVYISDPGRKKERTDARADAKEIYVAGLSKFANKEDLEKLFGQYGAIKEIRMALDHSEQSKGFAFVEFEQESSAQAALAANNHELKKRRIAVTLADSRVHSRSKQPTTSGQGRKDEIRSRSVRLSNIPPGSQEGLVQQALEKLAKVKRVEYFEDKGEAVVELENAAEAGRLLLLPDPIQFGGRKLVVTEEKGISSSRVGAPPTKTVVEGALFVPRAAASRPRAGLGSKKKPGLGIASASTTGNRTVATPIQAGQKDQSDFRKMLDGNK